MTKGSFGKNLRHYLELLNLSQVDLAAKSGLTEAAVSQIINGRREPNLESICRVLSVIPVKFEDMIKERKNANNEPCN